MAISVVWLKRDLRLTDHAPLLAASQTGLPVLLLYCFEPILLNDPHYSARHWRFVKQSLKDIQQRIPNRSGYWVKADAQQTLATLHRDCNIAHLFSHQEVGLSNTFERDIAIQRWCAEQDITWHEEPFGAVVRGLRHRVDWDKNWQTIMRAPQATVNIGAINWFTDHTLQSLPLTTRNDVTNYSDMSQLHYDSLPFQYGGENAAKATLHSFFEKRGQAYAYSLSSPVLSQTHCSRLSAYLAWGNISLRQAYQAVLSHWNTPDWRRSLVALSSRLHWHCHFIQKFESECIMEFRPVNRGYETLPRIKGEIAQQRLQAWQQGRTGIPMVDACMRSLHHSGYLNFRMRAMLVSFLCHHLGVDWRQGVEHLARLFLDFEPGIHYSQFQMQAGVTGTNTIRIYNPVKQGQEKDPDGAFVKQWLPELACLPECMVHTPWLLTDMEQLMYDFRLGIDYPEPIVDLKKSYTQAKELLWEWRNRPQVKKEARRILKRHVRPN
ncbi:MAG: deoxyribodipyrimidine photo-lyase [Candidatus Endobugula sp.]|jgi:deoxyribodipyrimidine photo-lyase